MHRASPARSLALRVAIVLSSVFSVGALHAQPEKVTRSDCLVMGDSIAVGISQFTDCKTISTGGLSSWRWLTQWGQELEMANPKVVLISLGANDGSDPRSRKALEAVRSKVRASKVMWLAPSATLAPEPRKWVRDVAGQFGDRVFELPQEHLQKDGIHLSWAGSKLVVRSLLLRGI